MCICMCVYIYVYVCTHTDILNANRLNYIKDIEYKMYSLYNLKLKHPFNVHHKENIFWLPPNTAWP